MELDELCVNTIRMLSAECVEKARSGHPGMPMGAAPMAYLLWTKFLKHNPANPAWPDRDRFVLSAGHGSMLLYSLLHLTGYDLPSASSRISASGEAKRPATPSEATRPASKPQPGPLGQGFANGVGMAVAERILAARFNRPGHEIVNHFTYGIVSDGDLMEGISHEAASLAGHLGLGKIIYLYDDNHVSIEGSTDLAYSENRLARFAAYGWHVQQVADGNALMAIENALISAQRETRRPSMIAVRTVIGYGSPKQGGNGVGPWRAVGAEEIKLSKEKLGWPLEPDFFIPEEALTNFRQAVEKGKRAGRGMERFVPHLMKKPTLTWPKSGMHGCKENFLRDGKRTSLRSPLMQKAMPQETPRESAQRHRGTDQKSHRWFSGPCPLQQDLDQGWR
jgi:transketolase